MGDFRDDYREASREVRWFLPRVWVWIIVVIMMALAIALPVGAFTNWFGIVEKNIEREKVQHSQGYTESHAAMLASFYTDYQELESGIAELKARGGNEEVIYAYEVQQMALLNEMQYEASLIPESEIPEYIQTFLTEKGKM